MTKQHFQAFADRLRADITEAERLFPELLPDMRRSATYAADVFAGIASRFSNHFDRERFFKACGL